jgi:hypothetical protein
MGDLPMALNSREERSLERGLSGGQISRIHVADNSNLIAELDYAYHLYTSSQISIFQELL